MIEYETLFYLLYCYSMVILPNNTKRILRFMRYLTFKNRKVVFPTTWYMYTFWRVIALAKKFELIHREEFGDLRDKRSHTSILFNGTLFRGRGSFRCGFCRQHSRLVHAAI